MQLKQGFQYDLESFCNFRSASGVAIDCVTLGNRTDKLVRPQTQGVHVCEQAQLGRQRARELVGGEVNRRQLGQSSESCR